uniref:Transposase n=1 Tax=Caenorhabditis tropicalis TaxID=1561998 RepID=A0A1I7SYF6_9PELO
MGITEMRRALNPKLSDNYNAMEDSMFQKHELDTKELAESAAAFFDEHFPFIRDEFKQSFQKILRRNRGIIKKRVIKEMRVKYGYYYDKWSHLIDSAFFCPLS